MNFKNWVSQWWAFILMIIIIIIAAILTYPAQAVTVLMVPQGGTGVGSVTAGSYLKGAGTAALVPRTVSEVKTDLSLNNVENTALSIWSGSANVTTLGTIATGVWNGTSIADANVNNNITIDLSATATALAANGANCGAGYYPLGVDASGAVESCTADIDTDTTYTAGRSLTLTTTTFGADSELYHHEKCLYIEDPLDADDLLSIFHFRKAATITGIWCESDQTVNMDLQLDDGTPADVHGTDLVCATTPAETASPAGDTGAGAGERLDLAITSVSGTPTWVSICFDFTYDD